VKAWQIRTGKHPRALICKVSFPSCLTCGVIFAARAGGQRAVRATCSDACFRRWRAALEVIRHANLSGEQLAAHRARRSARRAVTQGALVVETFAPTEVFQRDNWLCGLCGEPVDQTLKYPDPMSASLDHVIPISLGGEHSRANTRCSHLICNIRRGNRDSLPA
jgi:hypothetical protein